MCAAAFAACGPVSVYGPVRTARGVETQELDGGAVMALRRAAEEIPCAPEGLAVQMLGAGAYHVDGCGVVLAYECIHSPRGSFCSTRERRELGAGAPTSQAEIATARTDAPRTPGDPSADAAARDAVRARAASILACVAGETVALEVTWSADGALDASLRGELAGSPEESCVRAAIADLRIAAPGAPGRILHAVQR